MYAHTSLPRILFFLFFVLFILPGAIFINFLRQWLHSCCSVDEAYYSVNEWLYLLGSKATLFLIVHLRPILTSLGLLIL